MLADEVEKSTKNKSMEYSRFLQSKSIGPEKGDGNFFSIGAQNLNDFLRYSNDVKEEYCTFDGRDQLWGHMNGLDGRIG